MTPLEQHIRIDQGLQKINSNANRNILAQEKDLALNAAQLEIIKARTRKTEDNTGFAVNVGELSDIDDIIIRNFPLDVYVDTTGGDNLALPCFAFLPADYLVLVNDRSRIYSNCKTDFTTNTTASTLYYTTITFPNTIATTNQYSDLTLTIDGTVIVNTTSTIGGVIQNEVYNANYPYYSGDDKFMIVNVILELCYQKKRNGEITFDIFWERFNNIYLKDTFIVVKKTTIGSTTFSYTSGAPVITANNTSSFYKFNLTSYENEVPNRLINNEFLPVILKRYHSRTIKESPVSTLYNNNIQGFYNTSFIITKILIDYVRKPNKISLPLNRSCELAEPIQYEINDRAIEILMLDTANPLYQTKQQRNLTQLN